MHVATLSQKGQSSSCFAQSRRAQGSIVVKNHAESRGSFYRSGKRTRSLAPENVPICTSLTLPPVEYLPLLVTKPHNAFASVLLFRRWRCVLPCRPLATFMYL